ncbi:FAD-dependent oxidoreductase [Glycomyces paridis]|uniref:FAD-dependent monooxygenase n=1 Tax=Glycomyces paridis TaxID=2126555 RepID=A0A4S8PJE0_9ACTN|nr:NAD(P)/FAD-dependent oxidoreductase [Glycomyces paridis]THV28414.1 FAD-dependent monooxygenase [Glycomyces paridis]
MQNRRAVVVGAGVAGLASAIVLSRLGWRVALLERRERLKGDDLGMLLWASGVRALRALGVDATLDASGTPVDRFEIRNEDRLSSSFPGAAPGAADGTPSVMVHNAMLYEALVSRLGDSVEVFPATQVDRIDLVDLAAGDSSRRWDADLVVAADGIDSPTRPLLAPSSPTTDAGAVVFRGIIPAHRAPERTADAVEIYGPDRRRFGYGDLGHAGACWWATVPGGMRPESPQIQHELINRWFADWPAPVGKFIAATRPSELTQQPVRFVWPPPAKLHQTVGNGGVVLAGDAAHGVAPILAQGASLALEDAVTFAWALRRSPESVPDALAAYERARVPRIKRVARLSRRVHTIASGGRGVTRGLLRAVPDSWIQNQAAALADWQPPN